ncbi:MAG: hypothetical protein ACHQ3P_08755 [Candidatus Limnocylindrales bacterium]
MRGCLTTLLLLVALLLAASWLFLPAITAGAIDQGLGLAGFDGGTRRVTVVASPPLDLLTLHADAIHVEATDIVYHGLRIGDVDVTLGDVALLDRTAGTIVGTLTTVQFGGTDGTPITVDTIRLSGSGTAIAATISLTTAELRALATAAVKRTLGTTPSKVTLAAPDRVTVIAGGHSVAGRLAVDAGGGLVFRPNAPGGPVPASIDIVRPGPDVPIRLEGVTVGPSGATLVGSLDPALFRG